MKKTIPTSAENYSNKKGKPFWGFEIAVNILKKRIKSWRVGDEIGFNIKRKHFKILRDK